MDGMTVQQLPEFLKQHWPAIREQLLNGTYKPQPVKRVEIPKPGGGIRKLGIPTVLDRFVQQTVMQVLQGRWDRTFSEHRYGFRPGRSAHQAVEQAQKYMAEGYRWVGGPRFGEVFRPGEPRQADVEDRRKGRRQANAETDPDVPHGWSDGKRAGQSGSWSGEDSGLRGTPTTVRHERKGPKGLNVCNCLTDEGRPLGTGLQEQVPNHLRLGKSQIR